ncbi:MAG: hypothetical protein IJB55_01235 [Firmicutes bacterium]|nr:hypothetical protein [Bacillota bacterium]
MKTQHKSIALLVSLALLLTISIAGTMAYLVDKSEPVQNTFQPVSVPPEVIEEFENNIKTNVQIRNNGNIPAYIRAQIVVNWVSVDADGKVTGIYGGAVPEEDSDYTMTINTTDWTKGSDGFYYHETPVKANDNSSVLISSASLEDGTIPPDGYQLSVEILAQSIQAEPADAVAETWGKDAATLVGAIPAQGGNA